jgi:hypothetical protein
MEKTNSDFQITPETKIGVLLERFPQLEKTLIEVFPEFKKLRNPILRKTIARITSLRQAAAVAKVSIAELISKLRNEAGIKEEFTTDESTISYANAKETPAWFSPSDIVQSLDARPMLEKGEQPINKVLAGCKNLNAGEIYELTTPFLPAPLIDNAQKQGFLVWAKEEDERVFKIYITPKTR